MPNIWGAWNKGHYKHTLGYYDTTKASLSLGLHRKKKQPLLSHLQVETTKGIVKTDRPQFPHPRPQESWEATTAILNFVGRIFSINFRLSINGTEKN